MRALPWHADPVSAAAGSSFGSRPAREAGSLSAPSRLELALVAMAALVVTVGVTLITGRDLNWDYLNYHAYAALAVLQDRLTQDYFAAGVQGYLNPLPYLPMALMQAMGWPAALMASALAAVQSLNLVFLYLIARLLLANPAPRPAVAAAATVLGGATGVLWSQAGSSFIDATLSPLVLAALWLLMRQPGWGGLVVVGLLAGAGPGLKWTLVPYAVALWLAVAGLPGTPALRMQRLAVVGAAAAAGFLITYAPWGWRLYQAFGSPVFPLFNSIFQAADYPTHSDQFLRFVPDSVAALSTFPFRMALLEPWIYTEVAAPDLRPALAVVLGLLWALLALYRRVRPGGRPAAARSWVLPIFLGASLLLWLATSSNGRYATPMFLLLGPLVWFLCERVAGLRAGRTLALLVLGLQLVHVGHAGSFRWNAQPWSHEMLPTELPQALAERPLLFITVGVLSESHLATRVHPQSAFTNPVGLHSLPVNGPGWGRFVALRDRWAGRTYVVFRTGREGELVVAEHFTAIDDMVDRLGLSLVPGSCQAIHVNAQAGDLRRLAACAAQPKPQADAELAQRRELTRRITDALHARCPRYFQPPAPQVEGTRDGWSRRYVRHDLLVYVNFAEDLISYRQERQALAVPIGRVSTWEDDVGSFVCRLPHSGRRDTSTLRLDNP